MNPEEKFGKDLKWTVVHCLSKDVGRQRCRLPQNLINLLNVKVGNYIAVTFNHCKSICCVHVWKNQSSSLFQVDDTVTVPSFDYSLDHEFLTLEVVHLSAFKKLKVETPKLLQLTVILKNSKLLRDFKKDCGDVVAFIRDILAAQAIASGCRINLSKSRPSQLLGVEFIVVNYCNLSEDSVGIISSKTKLTIGEVFSKTRYNALHNFKIQNEIVLGGLQTQERQLKEIIETPLSNKEGIAYSKCILLIGPPGTGKSSLVRTVTRKFKTSLIEFCAPTICRSQPGESNKLLRDIFEEAEILSEEGPCVLFIDEIDCLFTNKDNAGHEKLITEQLISLLDNCYIYPNLTIVGATNMPSSLESSLRRTGRFDKEVYFSIPTKEEREDIIRNLTSKLLAYNLNYDYLAKITHSYVGADLQLLCQEVLMSTISQKTDSMEHVIKEQDFENALRIVRPSTLRSAFISFDFKRVTWDEIGGLEDTKLQLKQSIEWPMSYRPVFERLGISWPKGVLLYGPPGCCKTTLARAVATACNASFLSASAAQIYSPFVGDSEKTIAEIFQHARVRAPSIIFLDEIDSIVGKRSENVTRGVHEKVLSMLLNEMDGIGIKDKGVAPGNENKEVIVIAATNRLDLLDEALLRPGRFDRIIYVPPPDEKGREQILKIITSKMPVVDFNISRFSKLTINFSGADLENFCREAALHTLSEEGLKQTVVKNRHFENVLKTMRSSLTNEQLEQYKLQGEKLYLKK